MWQQRAASASVCAGGSSSRMTVSVKCCIKCHHDMFLNEVRRYLCALLSRTAARLGHSAALSVSRPRQYWAVPAARALPHRVPLCHHLHNVTTRASLYLRGRVSGVSGGPVALRRADGVGDAAVIFSRRLVALRVRPPRRVAFLNGVRLLETPAAQQISHLKTCTCSRLLPFSVRKILHHLLTTSCFGLRGAALSPPQSAAFKWQIEGDFQTSSGDASLCMRPD